MFIYLFNLFNGYSTEHSIYNIFPPLYTVVINNLSFLRMFLRDRPKHVCITRKAKIFFLNILPYICLKSVVIVPFYYSYYLLTAQ